MSECFVSIPEINNTKCTKSKMWRSGIWIPGVCFVVGILIILTIILIAIFTYKDNLILIESPTMIPTAWNTFMDDYF